MLNGVVKNADAAFRASCAAIMRGSAVDVAPRGRPTLELLCAGFTMLDPLDRFVSCKHRALSPVKLAGRLIWELCGRTDLASIAYYDDQALRFAGRDGIIATGYGARLRKQLPTILDVLRRDKCSRRAVGAVLDVGIDDVTTRLEYPCAIATHYLIRDGRVHCITYMRSESVWGVLPYDIALFTLFQEYVAYELGLPIGTYHHVMGSAHIYSGEVEKVSAMLAAEQATVAAEPQRYFTDLPSLEWLGSAEEAVRTGVGWSATDRMLIEGMKGVGWADALLLLDAAAAAKGAA